MEGKEAEEEGGGENDVSSHGVGRGEDDLDPHGEVRLIPLLGVLWYLISPLPKATSTSVTEDEEGLEDIFGGGGSWYEAMACSRSSKSVRE